EPDAAGGSGGNLGTSSTTGSDADAGSLCGNGTMDPGEECDLGAANSATAYGQGQCTTECKTAPYCGDNFVNGPEVCDSGGSGLTDLGACTPECSGYYEKKIGRLSNNMYSTDLGGITGADAKCVAEFGSRWKALIVGGARRATTTPFKGDHA